MKLSWHRATLPLKDPFTISRGTLCHQQSLIVSLSDRDVIGYGETTCNTYYEHTYDSLEASLRKIQEQIGKIELLSPIEFFERCQEIIPDDRFALSAVDGAYYDFYGKYHHLWTTELLGISSTHRICSSYTLGIDSIPEMIRKLREQPDWRVYKIKLGTSRDIEIVRALRQETDAVIRVDANCAWSAGQAIENSHLLAEQGVEFIEQPLSATAPSRDHRQVFEQSALPVLADESCRVEADVEKCRGLFHGINVKLCKCGGLTPAVRMLRQAREWGMKTMVGCMIESSVGISTAAQLLPLLDYADLDGATLLATDPGHGVCIENGHVTFNSGYGSGIELVTSR
ncbi:MAG TPA: dipeptide epimerase [Planctomicrobium sp.]|nr:dipeptide epimerase [Planctomicrobium sp.]